ncbi:hypothetical protein TYRP_016173 [Tyrophagus putrescentiae]|nr:hypothetical protein TYRP_016173 [Tyrophagus putrescentiae]
MTRRSSVRSAEATHSVRRPSVAKTRRLIRTGGGVGEAWSGLLARRLRNDGVADGEEDEELADLLPVGARLLRGNLLQQQAKLAVVVDSPADGALLKVHDVPCQRPGLVREDVPHLAELLIQVAGPRLSRRVRLLVVQLQVAVDKVCLNDADHLQRDLQRDGYQVVVEDDEGAEVEEEAFLPQAHKVPVTGGVGRSPADGEDRRDDADQEEDGQQGEDVPVGLLLDGRTLQRSGFGAVVHHQLRLVACVDDGADGPLGVAQFRASQKDVVRADRAPPRRSPASVCP